MRVGFDAHMLGHRETGNETYAMGLLDGFARIGFSVDAYVLDQTPLAPHRVHRIRPETSFLRIPLATPLLALRDRLDLFHATYVLPPVLPCPGVVTVHDISFALHPEWFPAGVQRMLGKLVPLSMRRAARVIAISKNTRDDIVRVFGISAEKIAVTYLAPRPAFTHPVPPSEGRDPYFLYVGNVQPRKNLETVVRALHVLAARGMRIPLLVAGNPQGGAPAIQSLANRLDLEDMVRFVGYVPDGELGGLYAGCTALLHPALYEGFGLTILEAMAQGAPVIASNASSIPEVAGDAAYLVDPLDSDAWAMAMERVATDRSFRDVLAARGHRRQSEFSWERCARETLEVYRHALRRPEAMD